MVFSLKVLLYDTEYTFSFENLKIYISYKKRGAMMEYILRTEELTKKYSGQTVVDRVSMTVRPGDIYGFVGKNGAGKTTFIRMILGLSHPDGGSFSMFDGERIASARRKTGSLVEGPAIYNNMSAKKNIEIYCRMLGEDPSQAEDILKTVGLDKTGRKKAGNFSLGMKQRLGIALALVGDPEFLVLDEPINGLDPKGIVEVRELLLKLRKEKNKTIFISSHLLGELEKIATRYGIISSGKLIEEITAQELLEKCGSITLIKADPAEKAEEIIRSFLDTDKTEMRSKNTIAVGARVENIGALTNELFKAGVVVEGISTSDNTAEEYFIKKMEEGE